MCTLDKSNNRLKFGGTYAPVSPFIMEVTMYHGYPPFGPQSNPLADLRAAIDYYKGLEKELKDQNKKPEPPKKKDKWLEVAQTFVTMAAFAPIVGFGQLILYLQLAHQVKGMIP